MLKSPVYTPDRALSTCTPVKGTCKRVLYILPQCWEYIFGMEGECTIWQIAPIDEASPRAMPDRFDRANLYLIGPKLNLLYLLGAEKHRGRELILSVVRFCSDFRCEEKI